MQVFVAFRQHKTKALVGNAELGIAPVDVIAGEARVDAKVLEPSAAEAAGFVDVAKPGDAEAVTARKSLGALAGRLDPTDDHVADHERELGLAQLAVHDVEVRAAHGADRDTDEDLAA